MEPLCTAFIMRLLIGADLIAYPGSDEGAVVCGFLVIEEASTNFCPPTGVRL